MKNPLSALFTPTEQRILLVLAAFLIFGSALQLAGYQAPNKDADFSDSLRVALDVDHQIKVDIRAASKEELILVPGIGEKLAENILEYRKSQPFENVKDLVLIKGIGPRSYEKMYPCLVIFGDSLITANADLGNASTTESAEAPVHINSADTRELCSLSGIGPVKAAAILSYRQEHGAFSSVEDLIKVKGIGPKTIQKNRSRLRL